MMRAAVALIVSLSMVGCFPHNAKHRTYAKVAEGGALVAGIAISAFGNTGADCDEMAMTGVDTNCRSHAQLLSTVGVALILGGLLGFAATVATAEDDDQKPVVTATPDAPPKMATTPAPAQKTETATPAAADPGTGTGSGSGSAESGPDAAPQFVR